MIKINLKKILNEKHMTLTDLSRETNISLNALSTFASGKNKAVQFGTLEKIVTTLGIKFDDLFKVVQKTMKLELKFIEENSDEENARFKQTPSTEIKYQLVATDIDNPDIVETFDFFIVVSLAHKMERTYFIISFKGLNRSHASEIETAIGKYELLNLFFGQLYTLSGGDNSASKALSYLIGNDILANNRATPWQVDSVFLFDYQGLNNNASSFNQSVWSIDPDYPDSLEEISLIADKSIVEINRDKNEKLQYLVIEV